MLESVEEIKSLRKKTGITQKELSRISGISQSAIAKIETGLMDPSFSVAKKIYDALRSFSDAESLKAKDIMSSPVKLVDVDSEISEVVKLMKNKDFSQFPVASGNQIIGIISDNNLLDALSKKNAKLREIMGDAPPSVSPQTPASAIVELLRHSPLVLVSHKGKIQGIITKTDILTKRR